ncbi:MAG: hypothetical protein WAN76_16910, partial [Candidatus Sulfotelmatobacter sp.]
MNRPARWAGVGFFLFFAILIAWQLAVHGFEPILLALVAGDAFLVWFVMYYTAPGPVELRQAEDFSWTLSGGIPPWSYSYQGLPPGCSSVNSSVLTCVPTGTGTFSVLGTATDGLGVTVAASALLEVNPLPLVTGFVASPSTLPYNATALFLATVSGGTGPLTFRYGNLPGGCVSVDSPILSCVPGAPGNYTVTLTVTDALGRNASASLLLTVLRGPPPPSVPLPQISAFFADPPTVTVGGNVTFYVIASGGTTPYTLVWKGLPTGCSATSEIALALSCHPGPVGTFS